MPLSIQAPELIDRDEYTWHGLERSDLREVYELQQAANALDGSDNAQTLRDLEQQYEDAWSEPHRDARIIRTLAGKLAAFARVFVNPEPVTECAAYVECEIARDAEGEGLETAVLDWCEQHAAEQLRRWQTLPAPANCRGLSAPDCPRLLSKNWNCTGRGVSSPSAPFSRWNAI